MAFIYEINGQRVEFEKEPTEKDIDEAARSLAPKPESAKTKPIEGSGGAAFGMAPRAGRRPESQQDREASKEMPIQTVRGLATGMLGGPSDVLNLPGQIYGAATGQPAPYKVPLGSEEINQMLPGKSDTPQAKLARFGGEALSPSLIGKVAKLSAEAGKGTYNFGKGFARGMSYPEGASPNTALAPIRETYVPHEQVTDFMSGQRAASTLTELPTAPLYQNSPTANWAYGMAPQNQAGQRLVPYSGRTAEGIGEQIGSGYRTNPLNAAIDIGTTLATGIPAPLTAIARSVPALAAKKLQQATNFEPGFGPARQAALQREGQMGLQAGMPPTQNLLPAPGPVQPTMIANQQGVVTGPGGTPLPTQASGQPVPQATSNPAQFSQQVAMNKLQQNMQNTGVPPATQQRWNQTPGYRAPAGTPTPAPVAGPVAPQQMSQTAPAPSPAPMPQVATTGRTSNIVRQELDAISRQSDALHQSGLEEGIKYGTPTGEAYQAQLGQLNARSKQLQKELDELVKAEKKAEKKAAKTSPPSNVSQMLTDDQAKMWNTLKQPENISEVEKKISQMSQANRDQLEKVLLDQLMNPAVDRKGKELVSQQLSTISKYRIKR